MIGRPDLCAAARVVDIDADSSDRQTQGPCYNCVARLVIGGPTRISFGHLHHSITKYPRNTRPEGLGPVERFCPIRGALYLPFAADLNAGGSAKAVQDQAAERMHKAFMAHNFSVMSGRLFARSCANLLPRDRRMLAER